MLVDLVGRGDLEAQPALPVRRAGDDEQQPGAGARSRSSRRFHRYFPDDMRPSRICRRRWPTSARSWSSRVPLVLLLSDGGWLTTVAAIVMIAFHLQHPRQHPDGRAAGVERLHDLRDPDAVRRRRGVSASATSRTRWPVLLLVAVGVGTGRARQPRSRDQISFLPGMRYYAGNWDTTVWCFTAVRARQVRRRHRSRRRMLPHQQLEKIYGPEEAEVPLYTGYAFRALHTHGRAHFALIPRALRRPAHEATTCVHRRRAGRRRRARLELRRRPPARRAAARRAPGALRLRRRASCG